MKQKATAAGAIFDAVEIRLLDYIGRLRTFENDYQSIEISKYVPDYLDLRIGYIHVIESLSKVDFACREDYLAECEGHLVVLEKMMSGIERARPELQKAAASERFKVRITVAGILITGLGVIAGAVTAIVAVLKYANGQQ